MVIIGHENCRGLGGTLPTGHARWAWAGSRPLNAFAVTFADRMPAAENL